MLEELYKRGTSQPTIGPGLYAGDGVLMFWSHQPVAPWQTDAWLSEMRRSLGPNQYLRMIENRWVTTESSFIDMQWWERRILMPKRLTDLEIAARIVPTMLRWPVEGKTIAWDRLRECVDALRGLIYSVNGHCLEAEQDQDLSPDGIILRRTHFGQQALAELADFKPLQVAEKAVVLNIAQLDERMIELPKPTTNPVDFMLEQEIRGHISEQKSAIDFVLKSLSDNRVISAVLNAQPFLSGVTDIEFNLVRERARAALHPEQSEMGRWLKKALGEVQEGMAATTRIILQRCEMPEGW